MDFDSAAKPSRVICCNRIVENHLYTLICKKKKITLCITDIIGCIFFKISEYSIYTGKLSLRITFFKAIFLNISRMQNVDVELQPPSPWTRLMLLHSRAQLIHPSPQDRNQGEIRMRWSLVSMLYKNTDLMKDDTFIYLNFFYVYDWSSTFEVYVF